MEATGIEPVTSVGVNPFVAPGTITGTNKTRGDSALIGSRVSLLKLLSPPAKKLSVERAVFVVVYAITGLGV